MISRQLGIWSIAEKSGICRTTADTSLAGQVRALARFISDEVYKMELILDVVEIRYQPSAKITCRENF